MASVRDWCRSAVEALREDGAAGLADLVRTKCIGLRCRKTVLAMRRGRQEADETWNRWVHDHPLSPETRHLQAHDQFPDTLSILVPTYNSNPSHLAALAESIAAQTCSRWEVCFYDGASTDVRTRSMLELLARRDARFRVTFGKENLGISGNTNAALAMATGTWVALCDHDDLLSPEAVWCILRAAARGAEMVYTDEDKCSQDGTFFFDPHLKEDFAPDSLRSGNYICHLMAMPASLMRSLGGLRSVCDGSQDHDLALRASEQVQHVQHIPRVLYHWRMLDSSYSHERAVLCVQAAARAVQDQLDRMDLPGRVETFRRRIVVHYEPPKDARVTLVVIGGGTESWLQEVLQRAGYPVAEVIHARVAQLDGETQRASGEYLVFLAEGVLPGRGWLTELLGYARRRDVACAGGILVDKHQCYLHCGYAWDPETGCIVPFHGQCRVGITSQLKDRGVRNVSGVSSALMCVRREVFQRLGGFGPYLSDARGLSIGLRAIHAGFCNVITPLAMASAPPAACLSPDSARNEYTLLRQEFGVRDIEHYYPRAMDRRGAMIPDPGRLEEVGR